MELLQYDVRLVALFLDRQKGVIGWSQKKSLSRWMRMGAFIGAKMAITSQHLNGTFRKLSKVAFHKLFGNMEK